MVGGCGFIGHNLALELEKKNNIKFSLVDSLEVNNIFSKNKEVENIKLYGPILKKIELI